MEYCYHLKPELMRGKELLPFAELESKYPELAKEYSKIYQDRPELPELKIPPLKATWSDVLFFSCTNPILLFAALELLGKLKPNIPTILKFPVSAFKGREVCLYKEVDDKHKFGKCNLTKYKEQHTVSKETLDYFIQDKDPLIFSGVTHLLLKGSLPINLAEEVKYKSFINLNSGRIK